MELALSRATFRIGPDHYAWIGSPVGPLAFFPREVTEVVDHQGAARVLGYRAELLAWTPDREHGGMGWTPAQTGPWVLVQATFLLDHWGPLTVQRPDEPPPV